MAENNLKSVIVSAPWGNYYKFLPSNGITHTLGTYTWYSRGRSTPPTGGRWWRVATTVRYSPAMGAWKNRIGLKNPGIRWLRTKVQNGSIDVSDKIISIYGWDQAEWTSLIEVVKDLQPLAVEINASCPNVDKPPFNQQVFELALGTGVQTIVKIPPVFFEKIVNMAYGAGVRYFHACNTLPTPKGGISGKPLLQISQGVVRWLRENYPDVYIIGGGGITCTEDAAEYVGCGANSVALGTMLFNPLNWLTVPKIVSATARGNELASLLV